MTMFASLNDLAVLLGNASEDDLTAVQTAQGTLLLTLATGVITGALGMDAEWAAALDPVPDELRLVTLAMVQPVMQNPAGARSESETLGAYSHSTSYTDGAHGLGDLTAAWLKMCRRAVYGCSSASARVESVITQMAGVTAADLLDPDYGSD